MSPASRSAGRGRGTGQKGAANSLPGFRATSPLGRPPSSPLQLPRLPPLKAPLNAYLAEKACSLARVPLDSLDVSTTATIADLSEFPFVSELPKREARRVRSVWDQWEEIKTIIAHRGALVPITFAGKLGGVSKQRVYQLIDAGKLEHVQLGNHGFVTESSLMEWVKSERKTGRPKHLPESPVDKAKFLAEAAREWAKPN